MKDIHFIRDNKTLLDALIQINSLLEPPLVLFVIDELDKMVGTLTDGDARRALIAGKDTRELISEVMHRNFNFLCRGVNDDVVHIKEQKSLKMSLIPILDRDGIVVEIVNLAKYKTRLPLDAVIMAGGKGERLRPLTEKTPKPLIKVGDKCIIDYNVERLIEYGVKHINVTVNYLKEQLHEHFSKPINGVKIQTVEEPKFLGTIGSIQFVKDFYNDTLLLMNSDLFTNIDFEDFYLHFKEHDADMSVAAIPYNVSIPFGILDLEGRNIKGLLEKPKYNYYANGGIYLIKRKALDFIPKNEFFNATDLIKKMIANNEKVIRYPLNGTWIDIGQHADLQKAQDLIKHLK